MNRISKLTFSVLLLATPLVAQDQYKLTDATPYGSVPGGYVGPYQAQVMSAPGTPFIDVFCVDYKNGITLGTEWFANRTLLSGDLSATRFNDQVKYQQAAWLALQFKSSAKSEWASIHHAIWNITSPGSPSISSGSNASTWLSQAQMAQNYGSINLDEWAVITDVSTQTWNRDANGVAPDGVQEYLTQVTPEPGTMVLLGTGLFGLAAARRRKKNGIGAAELE